MTRFLALDPSSRETGWAVFDGEKLLAFGVVPVMKGTYGQRFSYLEHDLGQLLVRYAFAELAYEGGSWGRFKVPALQVAIMTIRSWCREHKIMFYEYAPTAIKRGVTGSGKASKQEMARVIALQWCVAEDLPQHVYDAIAVGQVHIGWQKLKRMEVGDAKVTDG